MRDPLMEDLIDAIEEGSPLAGAVDSLLAEGLAVDDVERGGAAPASKGPSPPPVIARVSPPRRAAALSELAKRVEAIVASVVGPQRTAAALAAVAAGAGGDGDDETAVIRQLLTQCLAAPKDGGQLPGVDDFARDYFDPARFHGLPLRAR